MTKKSAFLKNHASPFLIKHYDQHTILLERFTISVS